MKRVFYIECSGEIWRSIAAHCREMAGWTPVLWTAAAADEQAVIDRFPGVAFQRGPDAALNLIDVQWPAPPLGEPEMVRLAADEPVAVQMMDRLDADGGFSAAERLRHFADLARTWTGALEHFKPDLVVFSIAPHLVFDYVLYALCRLRGVPTVMFERHGLPGWVFTLERFDEPSAALRRALAHQRDAELPASYREWLADLTAGGSAAVPPNFRRKLVLYGADSADSGTLTGGLLFETKRALAVLRRDGLSGGHSYLRSSRPPHRRAGWLEATQSRFAGLLKKRRLATELRAVAAPPSAGESYVLLALHYQPERSTVPMGGAFGDQQKIVEMLARVLPQGWRLYVKEHPWQLQPFGRGEMARDEGYYRRMARYANVRVMPAHADTASLIEGARAVATVSGSAGWQALCRGTPALVFGAAWYALCEGAFVVRGEADARRALDAVAAGARGDPAAIRRFVAALAEVCVPGVLEPAVESAEGIDQRAAAKAMARALIDHAARQ